MRAMVLAAGVGSRLRPLTDRLPKALVEVGGVPILEIVIRRLIAAGVDRLVLNIFHQPDRILEFLEAKRNFGIPIEISPERELLDTGGGLKRAAPFFDDDRPFFVHNADVFSTIDLRRMYEVHAASDALATLAVEKRESGRYLLFDAAGRLCGRESAAPPGREWVGKPVEGAEALAFDGIHVLSPEIFSKMTETGIFPISQTYMRLAGRGEKIQAFRVDGCYYRGVDDAAKLEDARRYAAEKGLLI